MSSRKIALIGGGLPSLPHQAPHEPVPAYALAAALTLAEARSSGWRVAVFPTKRLRRCVGPQ